MQDYLASYRGGFMLRLLSFWIPPIFYAVVMNLLHPGDGLIIGILLTVTLAVLAVINKYLP
jgi:hypothetical protein